MNYSNENPNYGYPSGQPTSVVDETSYVYGAQGENGDMSEQQSYYYDYSQQQQQYPYQQQQQQEYDEFGQPLVGTGTWEEPAKNGDYYFISDFTPEVYGHAVSALAYDPMYNCTYVASTTQSMSPSTRYTKSNHYHRASLLLTYSRTPSKELFLYSSVAGHPEASIFTLQSVYESIYGISKVDAVLRGVGIGGGGGVGGGRRGNNFYPPNHAYQPPYGGGEVAENMNAYNNNTHPGEHQQRGHMGITELLPLDSGFVASVSPSAVRIHSHGGFQVHDHPDMSGMISGTIHPNCSSGVPNGGNAAATHITVGGLSMKKSSGADSTIHPSIHCLDLWQGLRTVYSRCFKDASNNNNNQVGVTCMTTSHERGSIVAGCTDGNIRLLDGSLRELATIRSHLGGVSSIDVSPDGNLVATTGYSSKAKPTSNDGCSALYAFPDQIVKIYDLRYLGRGGISHPFSGVKGAPRHVCFVPDVEDCPSNRFLVASGKRGGGMQIITPFETQNENTISFFLPPLQEGESITAMSQPEESGDELALGTSMGRVMRYGLSGYDKKSDSSKTKHLTTQSGETKPITSRRREKEDLIMPPFYPVEPAVSLDPTLLQGNPELRNGTTDEMRCLFSTYILQTYPTITSIGDSFEDAMSTFGEIGGIPIGGIPIRKINQSLLKEATTGEKEYMLTVPTSKLHVDLLINHNTVSKNYKGKKTKEIPNPNKMLYNVKLSSLCYEDGWNGKQQQQQQHRGQRSNGTSTSNNGIPARYQLQIRPGFTASRAFDPSEYNDTGLFPGWDYGSTMPNAWVSPVLLLFYFIPEIRNAVLSAQFNEKSLGTKAYDKALTPELGFVFHQMESLSRFGLLYPTMELRNSKEKRHRPKIGAWIPSNFLTFLSTMGEAEKMAVLDDSPAAVDLPRRPESFYRFLAYQLDRELCSSSVLLSSSKIKSSEPKLMDSLHGLDFLSSNQFIESKSSPPTQSSTRALTLDLNYDIFHPGAKKQPIRFGELLQHSLCRETRLRAWNNKSRAYETIVQRRIATSLPQILTISCACAGRKEQDGLWAWRTDTNGRDPWLAETIEVELLEDGNVAVTEWHKTKDGNGETSSTFRGKSSLPPEVSRLVSKASSKQKYRYRLESVLSFVTDTSDDEGESDETLGHHVLHSRVPLDYKRMVIKSQAEEARKISGINTNLKSEEERELHNLLLSSGITADDYVKRAEDAEHQLSSIEQEEDSSSSTDCDWILYNSYKVSKTVVEDARAFHVPFKEPVLVVFQAVDEKGVPLRDTKDSHSEVEKISKPLSVSVMNPSSLSTNTGDILTNECLQQFKQGRPIAFDAEFVSVQEEDSELTESGQKQVLRDTRHALGRISIFDCPTENIVVDDHVLPREQVVDFLTRFSGIVDEDLDPARCSHRIISTRNAYLQLRYLLDQGCIFVGHGLKQDFSTVNLIVPPNQVRSLRLSLGRDRELFLLIFEYLYYFSFSLTPSCPSSSSSSVGRMNLSHTQIVDTVKIFHQCGKRYVSLRFLSNFVFGRDMQQDTHDSVEDARAAYELYCKALEWKKEGIWEQRLQELYNFGEKTSWKLGTKDSI
jgi:PAB-dependent poly(A)-specific ribonuclease subunit 2